MEVLSSSPDNYSFLDKDEVKKKVTFAAMAQSPSVDSVASIGSSISLNPGTNNNNNPDILLITPAHEVVFSSSPAGDLVAKLLIQNVSSKPVGYKIKTTSPDKYRVRPSTGILASNISTSVEIHCQQVWSSKYFLIGLNIFHCQQSTNSSTVVSRDKFLISAVFLDTVDLNQQQLTDVLKNNKADGQYRLRCQLAGASQQMSQSQPINDIMSPISNASYVTTELDSNRQMANIIKKVNQISVKQEEIASQLKVVVQILLVLVGLVTCLLVILLFYSNISYERLVENVVNDIENVSVQNDTSSSSIKTDL